MARKITVSLDGKVIGKRQTDRTYTHAVAQLSFDKATYLSTQTRYLMSEVSTKPRRNNAAYIHKLLNAKVGDPHPCGRGTMTSDDATRVQKQYGSLQNSVEAIEQYDLGKSLERLAAGAEKADGQQTSVWTWHSRIDLAAKEMSRLAQLHPWIKFSILPVDPS